PGYRAERADGDEAALVRHLVAATGDVVPGAATVDDLLAALDDGAARLLVVDDVHQLAGTPAERALGRLLALRPERLAVVHASRTEPDVNLPGLRVAGQVV